MNVGIELVAYRRLRNAPRLAPLITAIDVVHPPERRPGPLEGGAPVRYRT